MDLAFTQTSQVRRQLRLRDKQRRTDSRGHFSHSQTLFCQIFVYFHMSRLEAPNQNSRQKDRNTSNGS